MTVKDALKMDMKKNWKKRKQNRLILAQNSEVATNENTPQQAGIKQAPSN